MIDIHRIKDSVIGPILSFKDYDESGPERQTEIEADLANSSPRELMDMFLNWEGIIGYTGLIIEAWQSINAAVVDNPLERLISYCWDDEQASYQDEYQLDDDIDIIAHAIRNPDQNHIFCALAKLRMER